MGAAPTKIWSRIRRIKLITIHWNYWFSAKWCDFVEKSHLLWATSPIWLIFRRFRRLWCSFASIVSLWDVFESFSSTMEYQTGLNFLKENDFLNQHSELWNSFHKKKKFLYSYICDLEHFQMISLRTVVLGWWDKLMWWFLWYSTYNEQWNCRSIYQEEWKTWYRFKSYETFHNYFASKTNGWIFPQNSFRWGSGRPKFFTKAIVCANRLGNSLYSFSNQFQGPWQIL